MDSLFLAYLTFTLILVITPGSTTAVVVRNTLSGGRMAGLAAAAGAALGNASHATAAGLGLAILFARWPIALTVIQIGGALYLGWLGAQSVYRVIRYQDGSMLTLAPKEGDAVPLRDGAWDRRSVHEGSFRQGLTVNLLNPPIITFYLVVVPSFLPPGAPHWYFAILAAMHVAMAFMCHGLWAMALDRLRRLFRAAFARRALEGATAVALLALAIRVLMQR